METPSASYIHLLVTAPTKMVEEGEYENIKTLLNHFIQDRMDHDPNRLSFHLIAEEKDTIALVKEIIGDRKITIKLYPAEFNKYRRLAYTKRNKKAMLRCTHILIFKDNHRNLTHEYFIDNPDNLTRNTRIIKLHQEDTPRERK